MSVTDSTSTEEVKKELSETKIFSVQENLPRSGRKLLDKFSLPSNCCAFVLAILTVIVVNNVVLLSVMAAVFSVQSREISRQDQRLISLETQYNATARSLEEYNATTRILEENILQMQELQKYYDENLASLMQLCLQKLQRNDTESLPLFNESYVQLIEVLGKLQKLEHQIEHVENTSSNQFSGLIEVIFEFKQETKTNFSYFGTQMSEITEHFKNLSEHVNHLSLSRDDHGNQLSLISANLSNISNHLVQINSHLTALNSSQQSNKLEIQSLQSIISALRSQMSSFNELLSRQREEMEAKISKLDESLQEIREASSTATNERRGIKKEINALKLLHSSAIHVHPTVIILILSISIHFTFLH